MSSIIDTTTATTPTVQEQSAAATRDLCQALGLGTLKPAQLKLLTVALARAATEEAQQNEMFRQRVQMLYQSLIPVKAPKPPKPPKEVTGRRQKVKLEPIGTVDETELNPYAPPNPWALQRLYGDHQLAAALERYSPQALKEALPAVQERYPGTKPKRVTKPGIIDYIVEMLRPVTGPSESM